MLGFFQKNRSQQKVNWQVDIHSHLLPGLDDGVKSIKETLYVLNAMRKMGIRKVITTPHVMSDHYPNSSLDILTRLDQVNEALSKSGIDIKLEAAAEYYLDEVLIQKLTDQDKLLTFGNNYLLFETSFFNKPAFMEDAIFKMNAQGYQPVLAHPERYAYLLNDLKLIEKLKGMNLLLQMNLLSLTGFYSKEVRTFARKLLKENLIDFVGSDCHSALQVNELSNAVGKRSFRMLNSRHFLNHSL